MSTNGALPDSELFAVPGGRLNATAALDWLNAVSHAADGGVTLTIAQPKPIVAHNTPGTYRSTATQLDMRKRPQLYNIRPGITPALGSAHGWGSEVDVDRGLGWMVKHGRKFGYTRTLLSIGDYNHFHHTPGTATADDQVTPIPSRKRHTMFDIRFPLWQYLPADGSQSFYIAQDMLTKTQRIIPLGDWETTLINEETVRLAALGEEPPWKFITAQQWAAAFADYTYLTPEKP